MTLFSKRVLAAVCLLAGVGLAGAALAQDGEAAVTKRQDAMKAQAKDLGAVKAFLDGKGDLAAAQKAGDDLAQRMTEVLGLFPPKTGMAEFPGKSYARPVIWSEWDKFTAAQQNADQKSVALVSALKSGDKGKIEAAFGDMGKNGCGGCHTTFREPKKS
jgi:cytochrome c556